MMITLKKSLAEAFAGLKERPSKRCWIAREDRAAGLWQVQGDSPPVIASPQLSAAAAPRLGTRSTRSPSRSGARWTDSCALLHALAINAVTAGWTRVPLVALVRDVGGARRHRVGSPLDHASRRPGGERWAYFRGVVRFAAFRSSRTGSNFAHVSRPTLGAPASRARHRGR